MESANGKCCDEPVATPPAYRNGFHVAAAHLDEAESEWTPCRKTTGTISFIAPLAKWKTEKPFSISWPLPRNQPRSNLVYEVHDVPIADCRGREAEYSLDVHGFAFAKMPAEDCLHSKEAMETEYVTRVQAWVKEYLGAQEVVAFDYALRKVRHDLADGRPKDWTELRPPARNAHTDQTPQAALARLRLYFRDKADDHVNRRVRFINLWRPLVEPLEDTPLAVMDARSILSEDLMGHDIIYPHYEGENYLVKFRSYHRWYYLSRMTMDECILIKNFDSEWQPARS